MAIFRFQQFPIYNQLRDFRKRVRVLTRQFPKEEQYNLTSQLLRALNSIILNIAEGSDRYSDIDFSRFLNNSLTSLYEVIACLDLAFDDGYITGKVCSEFTQEAEQYAKGLKAFTAKVRNG